jgi:hypothetical protein
MIPDRRMRIFLTRMSPADPADPLQIFFSDRPKTMMSSPGKRIAPVVRKGSSMRNIA